ncbi:MAG: hypothetical protein K2Q12_06650 [Rickettsiales bacterium]|nr:hypothetical protein [Rickettsiales bacterium]
MVTALPSSDAKMQALAEAVPINGVSLGAGPLPEGERRISGAYPAASAFLPDIGSRAIHMHGHVIGEPDSGLPYLATTTHLHSALTTDHHGLLGALEQEVMHNQATGGAFIASPKHRRALVKAYDQCAHETPADSMQHPSNCLQTEQEIMRVTAETLNFIFSGNAMAYIRPEVMRHAVQEIMQETNQFRASRAKESASSQTRSLSSDIHALSLKIGKHSAFALKLKKRVQSPPERESHHCDDLNREQDHGEHWHHPL